MIIQESHWMELWIKIKHRAEIGQHTKGTTQENLWSADQSALQTQLPTTTGTATTKQTAAISGHPLQSTANQRVPNGVAMHRRRIALSMNS